MVLFKGTVEGISESLGLLSYDQTYDCDMVQGAGLPSV